MQIAMKVKEHMPAVITGKQIFGANQRSGLTEHYCFGVHRLCNLAIRDQERVFGYSPLPAIPPFGTGIADYKGGAGKRAESFSQPRAFGLSPAQGGLEQALLTLCPPAIRACSKQHQKSV